MIVIFLLIPLSIVIAAGFLAAFIWAVRTGQYEDTCTPAMRLLLDERKTQAVEETPDKRRDAEVAENRRECQPLKTTAPEKIPPLAGPLFAASASLRLSRSDGAHGVTRPTTPPSIIEESNKAKC